MAPGKVSTGVVFPVGKDGKTRSSSDGGKQILAKSLAHFAPEIAESIIAEKNWRYNYPKYFVESVKVGLRSPEIALECAQAGLDEIHSAFQFIRDEKVYSLAEAMETAVIPNFFGTATIKGDSEPLPLEQLFHMHYRGKDLYGEELIKQSQKWSDLGTISPDTTQALRNIFANPSVFFNTSSHCFVLLGASSEMGPFETLMKLGATVIGIDLPGRPDVWSRLIDIAKKSAGTLIIPVTGDIPLDCQDANTIAEHAGANILTQTPEIANWLLHCAEGYDMCIGSYTYLDSDLFVRINVAGDAIAKSVMEKRPGTSLAYLSSGADVFIVDEDAVNMAISRTSKWWYRMINTLSLGKFLQPNLHEPFTSESGQKFYICDGLATIQGPNYALAKRLQHWRAIVCRMTGQLVSTNIAPATFTDSVEHNPLTLYISRAISNFEPIEVFDRVTTKSLLTLLLLHDIHSTEVKPLRNPLELMSTTAVDCGVWRSGVKIGTAGEMAILIYLFGSIMEKLGLPAPLQTPLSKL